MTTKTIKIQYLDSIPKLTYIGGKSDWIDLAAAETVTLKAGEFRLIHLGVAMKLPATAVRTTGGKCRSMPPATW